MMFFKRKKSKQEAPTEPAAESRQEPLASSEPSGESGVADNSAVVELSGVELSGVEPSEVELTEIEPLTVDPSAADSIAAKNAAVAEQRESGEAQPVAESLGVFARIKRGLSRTSEQFTSGLGTLFLGKKAIDDELLEDIETQLLMADVGVEATSDIIEDLTARVARKQLGDADALLAALRQSLLDLLVQVERPLQIDPSRKPYVILVVGVNGVGKTTTIGKLAKRMQHEGHSVVLAAGDTFRAAAVEQLQVWGERNKVPVVAQHTGADSASVIFDAVQSAQSRGSDVVIADTAGRLHNKSNLMEELAKIKRVIAKLDATAPHEILLVLDAGTGQNAVSQTDHFKAATDVTGIVLTKLDGTAKGGVIFALSKKHGIPVRFIGVGETVDDLQPFRASEFVEALFAKARP